MRKHYWFILLALGSPAGLLAQPQPANRLQQRLDQAKRDGGADAYGLFSLPGGAGFQSAAFQAGQPPTTLRLNRPELDRLAAERPELLTFSLPTAQGSLELELVPVELFAPTAKLLIGTATGTVDAPLPRGVFYQGAIRGKANSLAALSLIDGVLSGIVADERGNRSLSALTNAPDTYLFYDDNTLATKRPFACHTADTSAATTLAGEATGGIDCKVIDIYFETDYQTYLSNNANLTTTTNYVTNLFNQVAVLYNRENVAIRIAGLKVWTATDPYAGLTTTGAVLSAFRTNQNSSPPPGISPHLSHLLSARDLGGGIAYLDVLCAPAYKYGVSASLDPTYSEFPNYSWEVMVVTHELGHNVGSPHTHSCSWPGGAIDNCYTTEGGCPPGPASTNGGTIMSYCHLTATGINLANGFGLLPGNLLRNRVSTGSCLPTASDVPSNLATKNVRATAATAYWTSNAGSTQFTVQYRPTGSSTWATAGPFGGPRAQLENLQPNTAYTWRVTGECSGGYSAEAAFTTGSPVYCTPLYANNGCPYGIGLKRVLMNGTVLSNNSGCAAGYYTYYPTPVASLSKQTANPFTIEFLATNNAQQLAVWIDFDQDYEFEATERVYATTSGYTTPVSGSFAIPASAPTGVTYRMRIRNQFSSPVSTPCDALSYGETEDYLVRVESGCPPPPTIAASATAITCQQSATLTVSDCAGAVAWLPAGSGGSIVVNPTQTTTYTATCTGSGCSASQPVTVRVAPDQVSLQTGDWDDPAIWSCGRVPTADTPTTIRAGHTVTIPANYTGSVGIFTLLGQLTYRPNGRLLIGSVAYSPP